MSNKYYINYLLQNSASLNTFIFISYLFDNAKILTLPECFCLLANILIKMASGAKISNCPATYFWLNNDQIGRRCIFSKTISNKSYKF